MPIATLQEEQLSILRKKEDGELLTLEDLNKMSFGSKVIISSLSLFLFCKKCTECFRL